MQKKKPSKISLSSANPFADSQARNYSGEKVLTEFCPISKYWSLFNDQHELLVGTRGCGKTLLLKMMRYSMLNKLSDARAKKLVKDKKFIAFYVPLHLEYIKKLSNFTLTKDAKVSWFRFSFNCLLAQSVIIEISEILNDLIDDDLNRIEAEYNLSKILNDSWGICPEEPVFRLSKLREKVDRLYYNTDPQKDALTDIPNTFKHSLASSLSSISNLLCETLQISPTWIVCVDEAEFAEECYQECINTAFRSDTGRIAFKVATLHFYHTTRATLDPNINVMDGQDFKHTIVDMKYDEQDFICVTDSIVKTRLASVNIDLNGLKGFLETLGSDKYRDYFSKELKNDKYPRELLEYEKYPRELLEDQIMTQLSSGSRNHNSSKSQRELKKPVIDKLAPIFYVREMYKRSKEGSRIPGWYAGASMSRRISQGNPRLFIRMMNNIFDEAKGKKLPLTVKMQHKSMMDFAVSFCNETQTLEKAGPEAKKQLDYISHVLQLQAHEAELKQVGITFKLSKNMDLSKQKDWIEKAVAFSRLIIDENSLKTQIDTETVYHLANTYATAFWLPMRTHSSPPTISCPDDVSSAYLVRTPQKKRNQRGNEGQFSLFSQEGGTCDANQK
jgi:hypothetical protein